MLQTNPVKRIKLSEIKRHRWFVQDLPPYLQQISRTHIKNENEVDQDVVRHVMSVSKLADSVLLYSYREFLVRIDRLENKEKF